MNRVALLLAVTSMLFTGFVHGDSPCHPVISEPFPSERYLIPLYLTHSLPGALGSEWVTEVTVSNGGEQPVWIENVGFVSVVGQVNEPIPPGVTVPLRFASLQTTAIPARFLDVEFAAEEFSVQLRARDVSREQISFGAGIPVVHNSRATNSIINLSSIPVAVGYRSLVRVYDFEQEPSHVMVRVYRVASESPEHPIPDALIETFEAPLMQGACDQPSYAQFAIIASEPAGPVRVEIQPTSLESRIWAFATITNNTTQQITVVSPN